MGFVDSPCSSSLSLSLNRSTGFDEDSAPLRYSQPFFGRGKSSFDDDDEDDDEPHTPPAKESDQMIVSRTRRKTITESQEIWEELEDSSLPPLSPFSYRRASSRSTPFDGVVAGAAAAADEADDVFPHEGTALLGRERSSTMRTYRSRRRRSTPVAGREGRGRERSGSAQAATGGWWKMRWWGDGREGKGKAKKKGGGGDPDQDRNRDRDRD